MGWCDGALLSGLAQLLRVDIKPVTELFPETEPEGQVCCLEEANDNSYLSARQSLSEHPATRKCDTSLLG